MYSKNIKLGMIHQEAQLLNFGFGYVWHEKFCYPQKIWLEIEIIFMITLSK